MEENKTQNNTDFPTLRTYSSDMADAIKNKDMSVIKIAVAEKERKEKIEPEEVAQSGNNSSKRFFIAGGIILIIGAIVGSLFLFQNKNNSTTPPPVINNKKFISYDSQIFLDVTNINNANDFVSLLNKNETNNSELIKAIFITRKINNVPETLASQNFLSLLGATAPGTFTRSLSPQFLLGKYSLENNISGTNNNATFLIFQTTNYNQTYASILEWEKTMSNDLSALFHLNNSVSSLKQWRDVIIENKDVRVLYGESGEGILYYVFVNKNNLVITENIEALKEVVLRLLINNPK